MRQSFEVNMGGASESLFSLEDDPAAQTKPKFLQISIKVKKKGGQSHTQGWNNLHPHVMTVDRSRGVANTSYCDGNRNPYSGFAIRHSLLSHHKPTSKHDASYKQPHIRLKNSPMSNAEPHNSSKSRNAHNIYSTGNFILPELLRSTYRARRMEGRTSPKLRRKVEYYTSHGFCQPNGLYRRYRKGMFMSNNDVVSEVGRSFLTESYNGPSSDCKSSYLSVLRRAKRQRKGRALLLRQSEEALKQTTSNRTRHSSAIQRIYKLKELLLRKYGAKSQNYVTRAKEIHERYMRTACASYLLQSIPHTAFTLLFLSL